MKPREIVVGDGLGLIPFARQKLAQLRDWCFQFGIPSATRYHMVGTTEIMVQYCPVGTDLITITGGDTAFGWGIDVTSGGTKVAPISTRMRLMTQIHERSGSPGGNPFPWAGLEHTPVGTVWTTPTPDYSNNNDVFTASKLRRSGVVEAPGQTIWGAFLRSYDRGGEFQYEIPAFVNGISVVERNPDSGGLGVAMSEDTLQLITLVRLDEFAFRMILHKHVFAPVEDPDSGAVSLNAVSTVLWYEEVGLPGGFSVTTGGWANRLNGTFGFVNAGVDGASVVWPQYQLHATGGVFPDTHTTQIRVVEVAPGTGVQTIYAENNFVGALSTPPGYTASLVTDDYQVVSIWPIRGGGAPWVAITGRRVGNSGIGYLHFPEGTTFFADAAPVSWSLVKVYLGDNLVFESGAVDGGLTTYLGGVISYSGALLAVSASYIPLDPYVFHPGDPAFPLPLYAAPNPALSVLTTTVLSSSGAQTTLSGALPLVFTRDETALLCRVGVSAEVPLVVLDSTGGGWAQYNVVDADGVMLLFPIPNTFLDAAGAFSWVQRIGLQVLVWVVRRVVSGASVRWVATRRNLGTPREDPPTFLMRPFAERPPYYTLL